MNTEALMRQMFESEVNRYAAHVMASVDVDALAAELEDGS